MTCSRLTRRSLIGGIALAAAACGGARSDDVVIIPPDSLLVVDGIEPSCVRCRIDIDSVATLGSATDDSLIEGWITAVARGQDGTFYVAEAPKRIFAYDSRGAYLHAIGRPGDGPGEFTAIRDVAATGDSVVVIGSGRLSVFHKSGRFIRLVSLRPPAGGRMMVTDIVSHEATGAATILALGGMAAVSGQPLYRVDASTVTRSFGPRAVADRAAARENTVTSREAASGRNGSYWISDQSYRLERLDSLGAVTRTLGVSSPWFEHRIWTAAAAESAAAHWSPKPSPDSRRFVYVPGAQLEGIAETADGKLLVVLHTPAIDWREKPYIRRLDPKSVGEFGGPDPTDSQLDSLWVSVFELIDPASGKFLARATLPLRWRFVHTANGEHLVARPETSAAGYISVAVRRLRINAPSGR